jgi:hypothetical protein
MHFPQSINQQTNNHIHNFIIIIVITSISIRIAENQSNFQC